MFTQTLKRISNMNSKNIYTYFQLEMKLYSVNLYQLNFNILSLKFTFMHPLIQSRESFFNSYHSLTEFKDFGDALKHDSLSEL